ncbi:TonB-dependent receptor plug domain-containing protein [Teredinibacter purpureus]|uniref:TonB-dependent receptor plug domain-containing protein n=1 Tax=Teredinibacter purpureus TaxID=2731756 RepID=UPI0006970D77|nr:TonB-dependent receptor [Teredinibacter purpureus]
MVNRVWSGARSIWIAAVLGGTVCALPLFVSAEGLRPPEPLEEMVVTGSRTPKNLVDSAVSVTVTDGETIRQASQTTVAQALNVVPGVVVKRSVKDGYNVYMQGFDGDRVLVLVDGQPLISPSGAAVDLDQVSVADIERIEIVRGAGSVLYGSSAMGGVINIITRQQDGTQLSLNSEAARYSADAREEQLPAQQHRVKGAFRAGRWFGSAQVQWIDDPGFDYDVETVAQDAAALEKLFSRIAMGREFDVIKAEYRFQQFEEDKVRDSLTVPGQSSVVFYQSHVEQIQHDLRIQSTLNRAEKTLAGQWQINSRVIEHNEISGNSNSLRDSHITLAEMDAQSVWSTPKAEWVAGVVVHQDTLHQEKLPVSAGHVGAVEIDDALRNSVESFAQVSWLNPKNEWVAGVRAQNDSDFGWHSAVRASGLKTIELSDTQELQWRLGAGQSYRVPTLKERLYVFDHSNLGYIVLGNAALKPETALSFNNTLTWGGHFDEYRKNLSVELSGHYSAAENLIETSYHANASAGAGLQIYNYQNVEKAILQGVDLSTTYKQNHVTLQLNYSYLDARNGDGQRLQERPYHQIKANAGYRYTPWQLDALLYVVHERDEQVPADILSVEQNSWTAWNINFSQSIGDHFTWRTGVDNLFNQHKNPAAERNHLFDLRPVSSRKIFISIQFDLI